MRHSWLGFPGLLGALVIVLGLVAPAHAVDWSSYIDRDARTTQPAPSKASRKKASKRTSKKVAKAKAKAKKSKVKARAKAKGKKARRR